jgi:phosphate transport system substrate-binding protein
MVLLLGKWFVFLFLILPNACNTPPDTFQPKGTESSMNWDYSNDTIRVLCTQDQLHLAWQLTKAYHKCHDKIQIEIASYDWHTPDKLLSLESNDLILVSDAHTSSIPEAYYRIKYTRDGVVGIIHKSHPFYEEILESGLGKQQLALLLTGGKPDDWHQAAGYQQHRVIKVFTGSNELMPCKLWTKFLVIDPADFMFVTTASFQDMIDSMSMVPLSMGLCCQRYAYDLLSRKEIGGIKVIPIDCNSNGVLEDKENFYDNLDELQRAMWSGKYPCHSFHNYYILAKQNPKNKLHIDFIKWVLTEGQKELQTEGFIKLNTRIIQTEVNKLNKLLASL